MLDPLSIASGVAGLLSLSISIADSLFVYVSSVKNAPKTIRTYLDEVNSLKSVLVRLDELIQQTGNLEIYAAKGSALAETNVASCRTELERINAELQKKRGKASAFRNLVWPFAEHQVKKDVDMLREYRSRFQTALSADAVAIGSTTLGEVRSLSSIIREGVSDARDKAILHWLGSGTDTDETHQTVTVRRMAGTGRWFIDKIDAWLAGDAAVTTFWCRGIPGAGKTVLMSSVVNHAIAIKYRHGIEAVAYIYFNYKEQNAQTPDFVFASIITQLYLQIPQCQQRVAGLYKQSDDGKEKPNVDDLTKLLADLASSSKLFLSFDALDEAAPKTRQALIKQLASAQMASSRIFITSRPDVELKGFGKNLFTEDVLAQGTDVEAYAKARLYESEDVQDMLDGHDEHVISEIVANVRSHAAGMFLLVVFQMDFICQQTCAKEMLAASRSMPSEANLIYEQALERIDSQSKTQAKLAREVLCWLILAKSTLSLEQLLQAIAVEPGTKALDPLNRRSPALLVKICRGLVVVDNDCSVRLMHLTVHEFLLQNLPEISSMRIHIAAACVTYMSFDCFDTGPSNNETEYRRRISEHPFYFYACKNVGMHLEESEKEGEDHLNLLLELARRDLACQSFGQADFCYEDTEQSEAYSWIMTSLHVAAILGSASLTKALLNYDITLLDTLDFLELTPLFRAIRYDHNAVSKLLLSAGAKVENKFTSALKLASHQREIVQLILEKSMKGDTQREIGARNLFIATITGDEDRVVELLNGDIDVNATDKDGVTALQWACWSKYKSIAAKLIEAGADIEASHDAWSCKRPIHRACEAGHLEIVQLLCKSGADIEASDFKGDRAIHKACRYGYLDIVRLLYDSGANIEAATEDEYRPLHLASRHGGVDMVNLLLDLGCDVDARNIFSHTALYLAIVESESSMAEVLIERGADVNHEEVYRAMDRLEDAAMAEFLQEKGWRPKSRFVRPGYWLEEYLRDNELLDGDDVGDDTSESDRDELSN